MLAARHYQKVETLFCGHFLGKSGLVSSNLALSLLISSGESTGSLKKKGKNRESLAVGVICHCKKLGSSPKRRKHLAALAKSRRTVVGSSQSWDKGLLLLLPVMTEEETVAKVPRAILWLTGGS